MDTIILYKCSMKINLYSIQNSINTAKIINKHTEKKKRFEYLPYTWILKIYRYIYDLVSQAKFITRILIFV